MYTITLRRVRAVLLAFGASLAAVSSLAAQAAGTGRIEGQITDSLRGRPAAGATVFISRVSPEPRTFFSVFADDAGRFRFDSLVAGRYALNFFTPALDSLELVLPDHEVILEAGGRQRMQLGLPSSNTLRVAACPGLQLANGQGAVVGTVTDATSERPIAGASVVVVWHELSVDRATLSAVNQERRGAVRTNSLGAYRLCGVPWGEWLVVQAQDSSWSSGAVETLVDSAATVRMLALSIDRSDREPVLAATPEAAPATARAVQSALRTGSASIRGVVYGIGDHPLGDVQLRVTDAAGTARTDSLGRFTLSGMPAGTQMLEARRVGYVASRVPVELRSGKSATQDVHMTRIVNLDSVRIVAQRSRYPQFERHRTRGWGRYLDEGDILRRNPFESSDLLRMIPGFRVERRAGETVVASSRGGGFNGRLCAVNVVIDGMPHMNIDMVHPADIAALEAYAGLAGLPPEYAADSPCGAVVIWTKR